MWFKKKFVQCIRSRQIFEQFRGYTLIELLITITIIGILVAIAVPSYQNYARRARYSEVVQASAPYKLGVEECFQVQGELLVCQGGRNGVPKNVAIWQGPGIISSISVLSGGKIIVVPRNKYGIKATDTYELTPIVDRDQLSWVSGGGGVRSGYAQ